MKLIIQYFEDFENYLISTHHDYDDLSDVDHLKIFGQINRLRKQIRKRESFVTQMMKEIQNNDRVSQLNSRQLVDFLRNIDSTKDGKNLSKKKMQGRNWNGFR